MPTLECVTTAPALVKLKESAQPHIQWTSLCLCFGLGPPQWRRIFPFCLSWAEGLRKWLGDGGREGRGGVSLFLSWAGALGTKICLFSRAGGGVEGGSGGGEGKNGWWGVEKRRLGKGEVSGGCGTSRQKRRNLHSTVLVFPVFLFQFFDSGLKFSGSDLLIHASLYHGLQLLIVRL